MNESVSFSRAATLIAESDEKSAKELVAAGNTYREFLIEQLALGTPLANRVTCLPPCSEPTDNAQHARLSRFCLLHHLAT